MYPGTPGIIVSITVSNLSITLRPNKKDVTRFEIAASQILMLLTHSQELSMEFLISERGEKVTERERLDTDTRIFRAHVYTSSLCHNIQKTLSQPPNTQEECV